MNRLQIAQYIALAGTALTVIGIILYALIPSDFTGIIICLGMLIGMVSYLFGGLLTAIKMAGGIAKWGWIVVPFPYDLVTFVLAFMFAVIAFLFLPIIPVHKAYKEYM